MAQTPRQRRLLILIILSTLAVTGILFAQGGGQVIAAIFLPLDDEGLVDPPEEVEPARVARADITPLLRRNIFNHERGDLTRPPPSDEPDEEEGEVEETPPPEAWAHGDPPPPLCEGGSMRLVGTFVAPRRPDDTFATITGSTGTAFLYQEGMEIDEREVLGIERNLVVLQPRTGNPCSLRMFHDQPTVATARPTVPPRRTPERPSTRAGPEGLDAETLDRSIQQVSDREFTIERSLVDRLLANQAALMRTARVIPHEEDGQVVGVKLYGIRRSSLLGRLGVQNGDLLRTINGFDMTSPDSALEAYARLRQADRITVSVVRRGQPLTIDYSIR